MARASLQLLAFCRLPVKGTCPSCCRPGPAAAGGCASAGAAYEGLPVGDKAAAAGVLAAAARPLLGNHLSNPTAADPVEYIVTSN